MFCLRAKARVVHRTPNWRRDGKRIFYGLSDPGVLAALAELRGVAERNLAEVREVIGSYFHARDALEPISRKELLRRLKEGLVTVLDVRPEDEFAAGHLPHAVNIPLRELTKRLRSLPKKREVVAYCRGPYCVLTFEAVALLRKHGFRVRRLEDGYPEWKATEVSGRIACHPFGYDRLFDIGRRLAAIGDEAVFKLMIQRQPDEIGGVMPFALVVTLAMPGVAEAYAQVCNRVAIEPYQFQ